MAQKQQNSPSQGAGFSGFPTRHPMSGNSNVLLAGVNLDNREYVIPTMVGGEKLSMNDAIRVARSHGLDHYPSFNSVTEASQWAETNHGNISADGKLNPTTQNNTNIMAQKPPSTFRQTIMGNAQPKPFWEQPVPTKAPPAMVGPAAPTPEQMQSMEPATSVSDFDLAPEPAPLTMQVPPTTQAQVDARTAERGGNGQEPAESLFRQILDTPGQMSKNADEFFGSAMRYFTPKEELGYTPPTGGDVLATAGIRAPGGDIFGSPSRTEIITKPQDQPTIKTTAAPVPQIAPEPAPEPAIKPQSAVQLDPTSDEAILARRAQRQGTSSPQQNFQLRVSNGEPLSQEEITQAEALAEHMGTTFDPVTGYSRQPFLDAQSTPQQGVQQGSGLTTVGGAPLNEFLSGAAMPERGFARAENAMYGDNSLSRGLSGDAATKAYQDASAAREARMGLSNRPGVDVPSLDMQRSRMDAGLDPVEGAPTGTDMSQQQQRDALERGFDPATGQPIDKRTEHQKRLDELEIERREQVIAAGRKPDATPRQKKRAEWEEMEEDMEADGMSQKEIAARRKAFLYGDKFDPWEFENEGDAVSTETATPSGGGATSPTYTFPTVTDEASYNSLKSGDKYIFNGKELTKK